jgi:hypothetical protein
MRIRIQDGKIRIRDTGSWINIPDHNTATDIDEIVLNTNFVSAEISYCSKANMRKRKKQEFSSLL